MPVTIASISTSAAARPIRRAAKAHTLSSAASSGRRRTKGSSSTRSRPSSGSTSEVRNRGGLEGSSRRRACRTIQRRALDSSALSSRLVRPRRSISAVTAGSLSRKPWGPRSTIRPSCSSVPILPPGWASASSTTTRTSTRASAARRTTASAAESPAIPPPTTATVFMRDPPAPAARPRAARTSPARPCARPASWGGCRGRG